jgi:hypothetical protein
MDKDEIKAELPEQIRQGMYANFFAVTVNPEYTLIDFGNVLPEAGETTPQKNTIVSRIITSKNGARRLATLINEVIKQSEKPKGS